MNSKMTNENKIKKLISALLVVSILLPTVLLSIPNKVSAFWGIGDVVNDPAVTDTTGATAGSTAATAGTNASILGFKIKDVAIEVGKEILKQIAKRILARMTQATINWINSDFHGAPLFLENPDSFFKDIAKAQITSLIDLFGYDPNRFPFGRQFALNTIASYKSQLATNAQYTLSKVINDPELLNRYRNDFNVGGWNGFLINTQYPQNNYIGFQLLATEELARRLQGTVQNAAQKVQTTLQQGMGFLSPQSCPSNPNYNNGTNEFVRPKFKFDDEAYFAANPPPEPATDEYGVPTLDTSNFGDDQKAADAYDAAKKAAAEKWNDPEGPNVCPGGLVSTTPGSVAANQVFEALNVPFLTTALDGALGNSLAAIFDALIGKLIDTGLNGLSSAVSPKSSIDNWRYNDPLGGPITLDGAPTASYDPTALKIPQNVSLRVGETSSTVISGGVGPYGIIQTAQSATLATALIDVTGATGNKLKVTAKTIPGTTSFTVKDSSNPSKTVTVTTTISALGSLAVNPANIITYTGNPPIVADISGGQEPYFVQINPNESFAMATVVSTNLIVSNVGKGATLVRIKDSSDPIKTVDVMITVNGPDDLVISPSSVSVNINQTSNVLISGGTPPYSVTSQQDTTVANAEIFPANSNILTITGLVPGTSSVVVTDSSSPIKIGNISVRTLAQMGICRKSFGGDFKINQEMDKTSCDSLGGDWTPKVTP